VAETNYVSARFPGATAEGGIAPLEESMQRRSLKLVDFDLKEAIAKRCCEAQIALQIQNSKNSHNG
jgi:hypothetical protein